MLLELLEQQIDFTSSEIEISNYILKHPTKIANMTAEELGRESFTSKATVIRFCKKLELDGFNEMKQLLSKEIYEKNRLLQLIDDEPVHADSSLDEIITILPSLYEKAIGETRILFDEKDIIEAIEVMKVADKIDIYGIGITYSCAETAAFKFQSIGIECSAQRGLNMHAIQRTKTIKKQVAIVLSFTGGNTSMVEITKYLKQNGIYVIGIGGVREKTDLLALCDTYIPIEDKNFIFNIESIGSYMSMTYILDILYLVLMKEEYDLNLKASLAVLDYDDIK